MTIAMIPFVITGGINLFFQTPKTNFGIRLRRISKTLLMPTLLVYYSFNERTLSPLILAALFFCWLGDIALMGILNSKEGTYSIFEPDWLFMTGLMAFLLGHMMYVFYFTSQLDMIYWELLTIIACVLFWYGIIMIKGVKPKGSIRFGMVFYMIVIGAMITLAILLFYSAFNLATFSIMVGAVTFGSSDSVLAFRTIKKIEKLPNSYVMFSYITGQFLIITGLMAL